jgi:glycerol-3-phosphate acyltransferase PlsY
VPPVGVLLAAICGYLVGAFPTGYLIGRAKGVDLRKHGSGNIGFTNAWRTLGAVPGLAVLFIDAGKAWAGTLFLPQIFPTGDWAFAPSLVAICVMVGNMFNVFLKGGGGKGIGTGLGVFLALAPKSMFACIAVFAVISALTRYISLGSLMGAAVLAASSWYWYSPIVASVTTAVVSVVFVKHKGNIQRLMAGTERKFGKAGSDPPPAPST